MNFPNHIMGLGNCSFQKLIIEFRRLFGRQTEQGDAMQLQAGLLHTAVEFITDNSQNKFATVLQIVRHFILATVKQQVRPDSEIELVNELVIQKS